MVWLFVSEKRRQSLRTQAGHARKLQPNVRAALIIAVIYNLVGVADIYSTSLAIGIGVGEEANPLMRAVMDNFGDSWIATRLILQGVVTLMVLWFPHRIVLTLFAATTAVNAFVVFNNFRIAFGA